MRQPFSISTETFIRFILFAGLFWILYSVRSILFLLLISLILATVLDPLVDWFQRKHIPRALTVLVLYILLAGLCVGIGFALVPLLTREITEMAQNFGGYWDAVIKFVPQSVSFQIKEALQNNLNEIANATRGGVGSALAGLLTTVQGLFGVIGSFIVVVVLTFYLIVEEEAARRALIIFTPRKHKALAQEIFSNIQKKLGGWARGQIVLSLLIGIAVFAILSLIGVPYAFALGLIAALLEFIPYIGPTISGVFGVFFALTVSPTRALLALGAYYIIQLLENNLLVPKVMEKAVGVNPVISILAILICLELFGVLGVFLAIPLATIVIVIMEAILDKK